mgnify:CR=1 FL=1
MDTWNCASYSVKALFIGTCIKKLRPRRFDKPQGIHSKEIMRFLALTRLPALAIAALPLSAAIEIDNFDEFTNNRFEDSDNPDQFLLEGFDLSGIGQDSNGKWATLIGPNTILSANHFKPSGTLTFYPGNDPSATPWETSLTTDTLRISDENGNGTDLWIARVDEQAPASIDLFDFATQTIALSPSSSYLDGELVYMTGISPTSAFPSTQQQAFGTNFVSLYEENDTETNLGVLDLLELSNDDTGGTTYEAALKSGDSGAPLLYATGDSLQVLGVNSYIKTNSETGEVVSSHINYIGNESDTIQAQIDAWAAVPEPGMAALPAGMAAVLLLLWQRRRRG